jgi:hypothetical protein
MEEQKRKPRSISRSIATGWGRSTKKERPEVIIVRNWREYLANRCWSCSVSFWHWLWLSSSANYTTKHKRGGIASTAKSWFITKKHWKISTSIIKRSWEAWFSFAPRIMHKIYEWRHSQSQVIIDSGVIKKDLDDVAWQIAKQNNIFSKLIWAQLAFLTIFTITNNELPQRSKMQ